MDQYQYADCSKTSVKVHHQPGGASQWSIGWAGDDSGASNQNKKQGQPQGKPPMSNQNLQQQQARQSRQDNHQAPVYPSQPQRPPIAQPSFNSEYQQPQRGNIGQQQQQQFGTRADSGERTSVKIHAPPGGKSSLNIFGGYDAIEHNTSPSRLRPKQRDVQYKIGSQYQVNPDQKQANNYGPSTLNQQPAVVQWQQQQNQVSTAKIARYQEQQPQPIVSWPSKQQEPDQYQSLGIRQPSPQRMAGQNQVNQGYVPSQFNNNQNIGGVRKSQMAPQQNYGQENGSGYGYQQPRQAQQQSDLNFGGIKQTQPPGGRSQIVLN